MAGPVFAPSPRVGACVAYAEEDGHSSGGYSSGGHDTGSRHIDGGTDDQGHDHAVIEFTHEPIH